MLAQSCMAWVKSTIDMEHVMKYWGENNMEMVDKFKEELEIF